MCESTKREEGCYRILHGERIKKRSEKVKERAIAGAEPPPPNRNICTRAREDRLPRTSDVVEDMVVVRLPQSPEDRLHTNMLNVSGKARRSPKIPNREAPSRNGDAEPSPNRGGGRAVEEDVPPGLL
jgi:hypothetical protein